MFVSSFALLALLASAPIDDKPAAPNDSDRARLQGAWTSTSSRDDTKLEVLMEVDGDKVTITAGPAGAALDEKRKVRGDYKLDDKANPKTWDFINGKIEHGTDPPDNKAIYKLEGDTLTITMSSNGTDRPTKFIDPKEGPGTLVLTRVKKAAEKPKAGP
jgi:uncharacterized protein (TIGR03067 family)